MTDPRETLARIRKQADAATPGPWEAFGTVIDAYTGPGDCPGCSGIPSPAHEPSCYHSEIAGAGEQDAEFIAASRTNVPALLDLAEAMLDLADQLDAEDEAMRDFYSWPRDKSDQAKTPAARIREAAITALEAGK